MTTSTRKLQGNPSKSIIHLLEATNATVKSKTITVRSQSVANKLPLVALAISRLLSRTASAIKQHKIEQNLQENQKAKSKIKSQAVLRSTH